MRARSRWLGAAVVLVLVAAVPAVALGQGGGRHTSEKSTPHQGEWRGKTKQGTRLVFDVLNTRKGYMVQAADVEIDAQCGNFGVGFFVGGVERPLNPDGTFRMKFFDPFFGSFEFVGKLGATSGSGTASVAAPLMKKDGTAYACSSGDVGWKASAPPAGQADGAATMHVAYRVRITQSASGQIVWSRG
jgi:hypothetical protein